MLQCAGDLKRVHDGFGSVLFYCRGGDVSECRNAGERNWIVITAVFSYGMQGALQRCECVPAPLRPSLSLLPIVAASGRPSPPPSTGNMLPISSDETGNNCKFDIPASVVCSLACVRIGPILLASTVRSPLITIGYLEASHFFSAQGRWTLTHSCTLSQYDISVSQ